MLIYKHLIYKEWIKTRWFALLSLLLSLGIICSIFVAIRSNIITNGGVNYLYSLLTYKYEFFSPYQYIPLVIALMTGLSQFVPEVIDKRIKLSFHLPVGALRIVYTMVIYGLLLQLAIYGISLLIYTGLVSIYLPAEIVYPSVKTIFPWFLGGFTAYFLIAMIALEPIWKFRIFYILVSAKLLTLFFNSYGIGNAVTLLPILCLITAVASVSPIYTSYRFKKGEH